MGAGIARSSCKELCAIHRRIVECGRSIMMIATHCAENGTGRVLERDQVFAPSSSWELLLESGKENQIFSVNSSTADQIIPTQNAGQKDLRQRGQIFIFQRVVDMGIHNDDSAGIDKRKSLAQPLCVIRGIN